MHSLILCVSACLACEVAVIHKHPVMHTARIDGGNWELTWLVMRSQRLWSFSASSRNNDA
jgi:hypothetical protein